MDLSRLKTTRSIANLKAGRNDWYKIVKNQADPSRTSVMLYDEIGYWGVTAQDFINDLKSVTGPIDLHLSSPGGEVFDGIAIHAFLSARGDVTTHVDSLAASIASVIAMAGTEIIMGRNASMMIHDGFGLVVGNAADMREQADLLDRVSDNIASIYADRTGKPKDDWRKAMLAETWYIGQEAVDAGLADRIAQPPAQTTQPDGDDEGENSQRTATSAHFDLSIFRNAPERLKNLGNRAPDPVHDPAPPPAPVPSSDEAPAPADRGFPVAAAIQGEPGPEPDTLPEGHVVNIEWTTTDAGDELLVFLRDHIRIRGAASDSHGPFTGTHTHAHPAFGEQGDDGSHEHEHSHDGDADHHHDHGDGDEESDGDGGMRDATPVRVLGIESMPLENKALAVHHTDTVDEPWDGPAAVAAMPNEASVLEYCHAWEDSAAVDGDADDAGGKGDGDADDRKKNFRFPHHRTKGGPANLAACRNGLARLPGSKIPDSDKTGVEKHLQAHLDDADSGDGKGDGESKNHAHDDFEFTWDPSMTAALKEALK